MLCNKCGSENRDGAKFCDECGGLLPNDLPEIVPPIDNSHETEEFDFSPIDTSKPVSEPISEPAPEQFDTRGVDEIVAGPDYRAPESAWGFGDTMKMPRVEGQAPDQKKEFKAPDLPGKKKPGRRRKMLLTVLVVVVLLFGVGAAAAFFDLPDGTNVADAMGLSPLLGGKKIPDVTGSDKDVASKELEGLGFSVKTMSVKSDEKENTVLMSDPLAGSRLPTGETVVLQVAASRTIPVVVGKSLDEAQKAFASEGLTHVKVVKEKSNEPEGTALKVSPDVGTKAVSTTEVILTVAERYKVPDVVGKDYATALSALEAEGYQVNIVYEYSDYPEGTVLASDPGAGTEYNTGAIVTLSLAKSRGSELVDLTKSRYGGSFSADGATYSVVSIDNVKYLGNDAVSCLITCGISYTTSSGEILTGETKQRAFTVSFDSNNNSSIAAS